MPGEEEGYRRLKRIWGWWDILYLFQTKTANIDSRGQTPSTRWCTQATHTHTHTRTQAAQRWVQRPTVTYSQEGWRLLTSRPYLYRITQKQHSTPNSYITDDITSTFGGLSNIWWQPLCADSETPGCAVSDTAKAYWVSTSAPCYLNINWPTWPPVSHGSWPWLSSLLVNVATSALTEVSRPIHYTELSCFHGFFFLTQM